jgi:probable F420-dependent oxidoreductase
MSAVRPFRFGVLAHSAGAKQDWIDKARRIEGLGYDTFLLPDHLDQPYAALPALAVAAAGTSTLRLGTFVLANDFRHPVTLARDVATLDALSGGRVELGLGAGFRRQEYEQAGIPYDPAPVRINRLAEALRVVSGLFADGPFSFAGDFYAVAGLDGRPKPAQRPRPPLLVGGGGKHILSVAAREADIVSLIPRGRPEGVGQQSAEWGTATEAATRQKLEWIRAAAGDRFAELELNAMVYAVAVTDHRRTAARQAAGRFQLTEEETLASPHALIGTAEQIGDDLRQRRERFAISYVVVPEAFADAFAPVVARLKGR